MGRIRSIKPEFPQSESMGRITREARLTFILLWTIADDSGRARESSRLLASLLYPYDDDAHGLISGWLDELEAEGCVTRYSVRHVGGNGKIDHYLQINNWLTHQKIDKPSSSKIPPFDEGSRGVGEGSTKARESSTTDQDMEGIKDQERIKDLEGMQGEGSGSKPKPRSRRALPAAPPEGTPGSGKDGLIEIAGLNSRAFVEWDCERRRRGGKSKSSWSDTAKSKAASMLASYSFEEQQAMVDASIANGWQGLFPPSRTGNTKFDAGEYMLDKVRAQYENKH